MPFKRTSKRIKTRSKFESDTLAKLQRAGVDFKYESMKIKFQPNVKTYTPDIILNNGIIIELKGYFRPKDRVLHTLIRKQHPELDIRFVFMRAKMKLYKSCPTTYADWCDKHKFKYAEKIIPKEWLS